MNQRNKAIVPAVVLVAVAGLAFALVQLNTSDEVADPAGEVEITLPTVTTLESSATTSTTASAGPSSTGGTTQPEGGTVSGQASGASGTTATTQRFAATTNPPPFTTVAKDVNGVEETMRANYAAVRKSRNVCDAAALLVTVPDPKMLVDDKFASAQVKEYITLWRELWSDMKATGPETMKKAVEPLATIFEALFSDIEAADYDTSVIVTSGQRILSETVDTDNIGPNYLAWRQAECPSSATFENS